MAAPARSDHVALLLGNVLHIWGGLHYVDGEDVGLPSDEIWLYNLESGVWARMGMGGELPPLLSQTCGSLLSGMLYVFGGRDSNDYTNQMYCVDLKDEKYTWKKLSACLGFPPSPRNRHSCWVYKGRLIYFGGYGSKTVREINYRRFTVDETSLMRNDRVFFRFWGWNNEVHIYEPDSATWTEPRTQGWLPEPRASHASATLGSKGYICGGLETQTTDIHCLDLVTWTWTQMNEHGQQHNSSSLQHSSDVWPYVCQEIIPHTITPPPPAWTFDTSEPLAPPLPMGRSLHTLTPTSLNTLFLFGGLSISGQVLCDAWEFDTVTREWRERPHLHKDKPRLWHSAVQGRDSDVVVYGGSRDYILGMDSVTVLRSPSQSHCGDVLVFQSQPYSLTRLCEDCIGKHGSVLREKVSSLPPKIKETLYKRMFYFKTEMQKRSGL